jgi:predicted dehydrogenase
VTHRKELSNKDDKSGIDEPTRVCIVGLGHWGPNIVRAIEQHPRAKVVVAAETSEERKAYVAGKIPSLPIERSFQQCLQNHSFDAVVVAVPTEYHFQIGMQALEAGKHILVEKPLAFNSQEAKELCDEAEHRDLTLMTGHIFLYNEGIIALKDIVGRRELGNLFYIHALRTNLGPLRSDVNALWDLASHDISIFNYIFDDLPKQVTCTTYSMLGRPVEDIAQGVLQYSNNRVAAFFVSWLDPQKKREITVVGDRQMLIFDDMRPEKPIKIFDKGVTVSKPPEYSDTFNNFRLSIRDGTCIEPDISTGAPLLNECSHFIDCVRTKARPKTDGRAGLEVVHILEALSRSANEGGRPVSLWRSQAETESAIPQSAGTSFSQ